MPKGFGETVTASIVNTAILLVTHEYLPKHPTAEEVANHAVEANRIITQFEDAIKKDSEKLYHYDPTDRDGIATTPFIVEAVNKSMSRAFVFLNCDIGTEQGIVSEMRGISGVSQASNVSGIYDIVAELSSDSNTGIAKIVKQLRLISSVRLCLTMIVAERAGTKASELSA